MAIALLVIGLGLALPVLAVALLHERLLRDAKLVAALPASLVLPVLIWSDALEGMPGARFGWHILSQHPRRVLMLLLALLLSLVEAAFAELAAQLARARAALMRASADA